MVLDFAWQMLLALAIGGLIGLEREKKQHHVIGVRTFALTSFFGMLLTAITEDPLIVALGLAGTFVLAALYYYQKARHIGKWGVTTAMMLPTTMGLGALVGMGFYVEASLAAILAVFLLIEGKEVHAITEKVSKKEIIDLLLFAIIAFIIYPQLPGQPVFVLGQALDLRFFWTIVVLITAISFAGFVIVKYIGSKALTLASFFGGFVSSLAVVAVMAGKIGKKKANLQAVLTSASAGSITSDSIVLSIVSLPLLVFASPMLAAFLIAFVSMGLFYAKKIKNHEFHQAKRPLSLTFIAEFSVAFFLVNWILNWAAQNAPSQIILTSFAGGILSSVSVIATLAFLYNTGAVGAQTAVYCFFSAIAASLAAKVFVAGISTGGWKENLKISIIALAAGAIGIAAGFAFKIF
ncbi:MAG: DUF4010 domain-containing protein [Candidatus Micrarchaeota archaeon]